MCTSAELGDDHAQARGDPIEIALLEAGRRLGLKRASLVEEMPEVRRKEFDRDTGMMATVRRTGDGFRLAIKGAPEAVLQACRRVRTEDGEQELDETLRGVPPAYPRSAADRAQGVIIEHLETS